MLNGTTIPTPHPSQDSDNPSPTMEQVLRTTTAVERAIVQWHRLHGLNGHERMVLRTLWELGPLSMGVLAASTGLSRPAMTTLVERLESQGLLVRTPHAADRRMTIVDTRIPWPELVAPYQGGFRESFHVIINSMDDDEQAVVGRFLDRVRNACDAEATTLMGLSEDELRDLDEGDASWQR